MSQPLPLCHHARTNGRMCESPALNGKRFCYYHQRDRDRRDRLEQNNEYRRGLVASKNTYEMHALLPDGKTVYDDNSVELFQDLQTPLFEDGDAVQIELSTLYRTICTRQIDHGTAKLLLYNLQIASANLRNTRPPGYRLDGRATQDETPIQMPSAMQELFDRARAKAATLAKQVTAGKSAGSAQG